MHLGEHYVIDSVYAEVAAGVWVVYIFAVMSERERVQRRCVRAIDCISSVLYNVFMFLLLLFSFIFHLSTMTCWLHFILDATIE